MSKSKEEKHKATHASGSGTAAVESNAGGDGAQPAAGDSGAGAEGYAPSNPTEQVVSEVETLRSQVAAKDRETAELKDRYLRAVADSENTRKRMRQQSEETVRLQREQLLRDLLPIIDNLERAVDAARGGGNGKPIVEGVEMVLRSLLDFLRGHGVIPAESVGQTFDPQFHEAVDHVESAEHAPNTVISELHRGYRIGERVLRPARVAVSKRPSRNNGEGGIESK